MYILKTSQRSSCRVLDPNLAPAEQSPDPKPWLKVDSIFIPAPLREAIFAITPWKNRRYII